MLWRALFSQGYRMYGAEPLLAQARSQAERRNRIREDDASERRRGEEDEDREANDIFAVAQS